MNNVAVANIFKHLEKITNAFSASVEIIEQLILIVGLELVWLKMEVILITGRKKRETIPSQYKIVSQPYICYPGMLIDMKLIFKDHMLSLIHI